VKASKQWATILHINDATKLMDVWKACNDISKKDQTFQYSVNSKLKKIIIYSNTKDQAHKRGMWFHHKFNLYYDVSLMASTHREEEAS
jgi:hypothetical protein